jgi:hypothetical protein
MTLQAVRTAIETPVIAALGAFSPAIPTLVENQFYQDNDALSEFGLVRVQFGLMSEDTLCEPMERVRGVVVVEVFTAKGEGPGRAQEVAAAVLAALADVNLPPATSGSIRVRIGQLDGPSFTPLDGRPHLATRISAPLRARVD